MAETHDHAEIIAAWVRGALIEGQSPVTDEWIRVPPARELGVGENYLEPSPIHPEYDWWPTWRIVPET